MAMAPPPPPGVPPLGGSLPPPPPTFGTPVPQLAVGFKRFKNWRNSSKFKEDVWNLGHVFHCFGLKSFFWGWAYDQGIIIFYNLIWCIKIWFPLAINVGSPKQVTCFSKDGKSSKLFGENPHDTSSDLGYLSTNHAESWLKNQRCRWRVWRCDSWVVFFPSHTFEQNNYEEP